MPLFVNSTDCLISIDLRLDSCLSVFLSSVPLVTLNSHLVVRLIPDSVIESNLLAEANMNVKSDLSVRFLWSLSRARSISKLQRAYKLGTFSH